MVVRRTDVFVLVFLFQVLARFLGAGGVYYILKVNEFPTFPRLLKSSMPLLSLVSQHSRRAPLLISKR